MIRVSLAALAVLMLTACPSPPGPETDAGRTGGGGGSATGGGGALTGGGGAATGGGSATGGGGGGAATGGGGGTSTGGGTATGGGSASDGGWAFTLVNPPPDGGQGDQTFPIQWTSTPARPDLNVTFFVDSLPPLPSSSVIIGTSQPVGSGGTSVWNTSTVAQGRYSLSASIEQGSMVTNLFGIGRITVNHGSFGIPSIEVYTPLAGDVMQHESRAFTIDWKGFDLDGAASVSFFLDTDGVGLNGTEVIRGEVYNGTSNPQSSVILPPIPVGTHHVYGEIYDDHATSGSDYAPGTLTVYGFENDALPLSGNREACVLLTSQGVPRTIYSQDGGVWHGSWAPDAGWSSTWLTGFTGSSVGLACAFDQQGRLSAVVKPGSGSTMFVQEGTSSWSITTPSNAPSPARRTLVFDSANQPAMCWVESFNAVHVARLNGNAWTDEVVQNGIDAHSCTLHLAPSGHLVVAYSVDGPGSSGYDLHLATQTDAGWQRETIDQLSAPGNQWAVAFAPTGEPWVASSPPSRDGGNVRPLVLSRRTDAGWQGEPVLNPFAYVDVGGSASLRFEDGGIPTIATAYYRGTGSGFALVRRLPTGFQVLETGAFTAGTPSYPGIVHGLDAQGRPIVVTYHYAQDEAVTVYRWKR